MCPLRISTETSVRPFSSIVDLLAYYSDTLDPILIQNINEIELSIVQNDKGFVKIGKIHLKK